MVQENSTDGDKQTDFFVKLQSTHTSKPGMVAQPTSYLGGRDQEEHGSRPAEVQSSQDSTSTPVWVQWQAPVIPAIQGSTKGGSESSLA
jgi:hypothetical protein